MISVCFTPVLFCVSEPTTTKDEGIKVHGPDVCMCAQYKELHKQGL